ncbi:hypothetical protein E2C01_048535 [Portunus trituberculatus]|uniref:Uncharacterized protein n=1 Tax=Portunus trituberculatus TaxID=210409 RepID=A0A5B7G6P2_PORTR|nr:hypothetical protein [Portunus trituberculatus]
MGGAISDDGCAAPDLSTSRGRPQRRLARARLTSLSHTLGCGTASKHPPCHPCPRPPPGKTGPSDARLNTGLWVTVAARGGGVGARDERWRGQAQTAWLPGLAQPDPGGPDPQPPWPLPHPDPQTPDPDLTDGQRPALLTGNAQPPEECPLRCRTATS